LIEPIILSARPSRLGLGAEPFVEEEAKKSNLEPTDHIESKVFCN
jgi:hypothetical protein